MQQIKRLYHNNSIGLMVVPLLIFPIFAGGNPYLMFTGILALYTIGVTLTLRLKLSSYLLDIAGHLAWVGMGAYFSSALQVHLGWPFWVNLIAVPPIVGLISVLVAMPAIRTQGVYLAIVAIAFADIVVLFFGNMFTGVFGGHGGLYALPGVNNLGPISFGKDDHVAYYFLLVGIMAFIVYILRRIDRSRIGLSFRSVREQADLSEAVGLNVYWTKVLNWGISCSLAGLLGVFFAAYLRAFNPDEFSSAAGFFLMAYIIIGGRGHLLGPALGVVLFVVMRESLRSLELWQSLFWGVIMIIFIMFIPDGIYGLIKRGWEWGIAFRARQAAAPVPAPAAVAASTTPPPSERVGPSSG
ncbi:MAG: branched-chain amino acid ABC transporter permease [SAR202 cluster bacterium]|nr:branched-chain amino acid ABC transporter permease [SAR202 cluster bacterium]